jgi:hypothetical protein
MSAGDDLSGFGLPVDPAYFEVRMNARILITVAYSGDTVGTLMDNKLERIGKELS